MQGAIFAVVIVFLVFFSAMTITVLARSGFDIFTVFSLLIIALIGFGVIGAIRNPPPDE
jgi:hypothetical protein